MRKIISLFQRNYETDRQVRDEVTPGAEWVINGEGIATVKYDGTCCLIKDGQLFKRYDAKKGRTPPSGFIPAQETPDEVTGHWPGWLLVKEDDPDTKYHSEAFNKLSDKADGTYELIGPAIQGNPEGCDSHELVKHGCSELPYAPRNFYELRRWLTNMDIEGIVWHHPDGRMVKIKKKDFGLPRNYGVQHTHKRR
jgi:hypothetical protein